MNSVYPPSHFGYSGPGGPNGPGGGPGPGGGFPNNPRNDSPMMTQAKMAVGVNNMNMMSRVPPATGGPAGDDEPKMCAGCGQRIVEKTLLHSMERYWHEACLRCTCCGSNLADSASCFIKSGMILCKPDYVRMFGHCGVCAACGQGIPASEFVMRVGAGLVYHIRCFSCSKCNTALARGDRYLLVNGAPVCEQDANKLFPPVKKGKVGRPRRQRD